MNLLNNFPFQNLDFILTSQDNVASSLRLIQVYTDVKSYGASEGQNIVNKIYKHLISQNYYEKVRALADARLAILLYTVQFSFVMLRILKHVCREAEAREDMTLSAIFFCKAEICKTHLLIEHFKFVHFPPIDSKNHQTSLF